MKSVIVNYIKPVLLKCLFAYKEKFLRAPVPPPELTTYTWGSGPAETANQIPKIVWLYWHQGNMPIICQQCVKRIERLNPDFKVNVLDAESVHSFLPELAHIAVNQQELPLAVYSDLIRLMLLEKFGGFWMDISTILNSRLTDLCELAADKQVELLLFTKPANGYASSAITNLAYPVTENWFLGAIKNSKFISDWKNELVKCLISPNPVDYYKKDENYSEYVKYLPDSMLDYLLAYISAQVVMRKSKQEYRILFMDAFETGYLYSKTCLWNNELTVKLLTSVEQAKQLPLMIKLTSDIRRIAELAIKNKSYTPTSLMQDLLNE